MSDLHEVENANENVENGTEEKSGLGTMIGIGIAAGAAGLTVGTFLGGKIKSGAKKLKEQHKINKAKRATKKLEKARAKANKEAKKLEDMEEKATENTASETSDK